MKKFKSDDKSISESGLVPEYKKMLKEVVENMNNKCMEIQEIDNTFLNLEKSIVRKFPKCMVRAAMQECLCEDDCLKDIFEGVQWSERCYLYNLSYFYNVKDYISCDAAAYRPKSNRLYEYHFGDNHEKARNNFFRYLEEFCTDPSVFNKFKCAAYELRDEFRNNKQAIHGLKMNPNFKECDNPKNQNQLSVISSILLSSPEDRPANKIFEDQYFKRSGNNQNIGRSLKQFYENSTKKDNQLFMIEHEKYNFKILISFGLLGVISYAIYKSRKLKSSKKMLLIIITVIIVFFIMSI